MGSPAQLRRRTCVRSAVDVAARGDVIEPRCFRSLFVLARRGESRKRNLLPPGSLDHLVGACEKSRGEVNTDRLRRHIIHRQLKLGWLLDRQVGRVGTAQDSDRLSRQEAQHLGETWAVSEQPALFRGVRPLIDGRQAQLGRAADNAAAIAVQER